MAREKRAESAPVSREGDSVRQRREFLGLHKNELAEKAGVSRDTLAAIEAGEGFRRTSLTKIEKALDAEETLHGVDAPPLTEDESAAPQSKPVVIRLAGGALVVEGPIEELLENMDALIEAAERLRRGDQDDPK